MATKKLKTILRELGLPEDSAESYFDYILDSYLLGKKMDVSDLFNELKRDDKHDCIKYIRGIKSGESEEVLTILISELIINLK